MKKIQHHIKRFGVLTMGIALLVFGIIYGIGTLPYWAEANYKMSGPISIKKNVDQNLSTKNVVLEPAMIVAPSKLLIDTKPIVIEQPPVVQPKPTTITQPIVIEQPPVAQPKPTTITQPIVIEQPPVITPKPPVIVAPVVTELPTRPTRPVIVQPQNPIITPIVIPPIEIVVPPLTDIQKNIKKYREYKQRLKEKFVRVTSSVNDHGANLVASKRKALAGRGSDIVDFGDTMGWMGFYLGILATEYKLLKNEGKDTTQTLKELFYAMLALERLDNFAEPYFGGGNTTNGFFIRDDVPSYRYPKCDTALGNIENSFAYHFGSDMKKIGYSFGTCDLRNNEMSQDQVWTLMLGLSLVKKLMHDDGNLTFAGENYNFGQNAQDMTERIIRYIQVTEKVKITPWTTINIKKWRIYNPVTKELVKRGSMGGSDTMAGFAYGFAKAATSIVEKNMEWKDSLYPERLISKGIFDQMKNGNVNTAQQALSQIGMGINTYSLFGGRLLGTIGDIRGPDVVNLTNNVYDFMGMLHYVLYGNTETKRRLGDKMSFFQNQLNAAPSEGPYNFGGNDRPASYDWTSQSLLWDPEDRGTIALSDANKIRQKAGEYNGLDYLLLHNLFLLTYKDNIESFTFGK